MNQRGWVGGTRTDVTTPQPASHQESPPVLVTSCPPRGMSKCRQLPRFPPELTPGKRFTWGRRTWRSGDWRQSREAGRKGSGGQRRVRLIFKDKPRCVCPAHVRPGCPGTCRRNWHLCHVATAQGSGRGACWRTCPVSLGSRQSNKGTVTGALGHGVSAAHQGRGGRRLEIRGWLAQ